MADWVAVSVDIGDDPKVIAFGKQLGVETDSAAMCLVRLWGRMARHENETGSLADVDDATLEEWARWKGRRGRFAGEFRRRFTEDGIVNGWWSWNGRHLRRARLDREKKRKDRGYDDPPPPPTVRRQSADGPQNVAGLSDAITGTGTGTITTHHTTEAVPGFAALFARLPDVGGARIAVTEFLEASPKGRERGWIGVITACLDGLDMPDGKPCPPERLATVCRDFLTKPVGDWNAKFFRACAATPEHRMTTGPGPSGASERTIRAAADFAEEGAA